MCILQSRISLPQQHIVNASASQQKVSSLLTTMPLEERHTAANIAILSGLRMFVQTALKKHQTISKCAAAARCLVEHFKKSELACTKLKNKQQQMGTPQHAGARQSTRRNSTYHMLTRLLQQRWPVTAAVWDPERR